MLAAMILLFTAACGSAATNPATEALDGTEMLLTNQPELDANADAGLENESLPDTTPTGLELVNTVSAEDGGFTVGYPDGWFAQTQGSMATITNQGEVTETTELQTVGTGQAVMTVSLIPREQFEQTNLGLNDMARQLIQTLMDTANAEEATFGDPAEGEINGNPAVWLTGTTTTGDQPTDTQIILIDRDEENVIIQVILQTAAGESEQFEGTAQQVAGSVQIESGAVTGTEEAADLNDVNVSTDEIDAETTVTITSTRDAGDGTPDAGTPGSGTSAATPTGS